jgi:CRP/FNR family transcriptional regulator, cyclic AMP receptor protein
MVWSTTSSGDSRDNGARRAGATATVQPEILAEVGLFANLTTAELVGLAALVEPWAYARNEVIYRRGELGTALYVVASGSVKVSLTLPEGKEVVLRRLGPGEVHGELALLDNEPHAADASATEPSVVLVLQRDAFRRYLADHPSAARKLLHTVRH